jgi:hypothetical protein
MRMYEVLISVDSGVGRPWRHERGGMQSLVSGRHPGGRFGDRDAGHIGGYSLATGMITGHGV